MRIIIVSFDWLLVNRRRYRQTKEAFISKYGEAAEGSYSAMDL